MAVSGRVVVAVPLVVAWVVAVVVRCIVARLVRVVGPVGMRVTEAAVMVVVAVGAVVMPVLVVFAHVAPEEHHRAEHRDGQPRAEAQPRVQLLGDDVLRGVERDPTQQVDAGRVGRGDDQPEDERVACGAA